MVQLDAAGPTQVRDGNQKSDEAAVPASQAVGIKYYASYASGFDLPRYRVRRRHAPVKIPLVRRANDKRGVWGSNK